MMTQGPLRFVFVGGTRPWKPLEGHDVPSGTVCELRSLPGNLVAWGNTTEEAVRRLQSTIDFTLNRANSPEEWFDCAYAGMTEKDSKEYETSWVEVLHRRLPIFQRAPYEYANLLRNGENAELVG